MNKKQLGKLVLSRVKFRPIARRFNLLTGEPLPLEDDTWTVRTETPRGLWVDTSSGHGFELAYDHIREFMSDSKNPAGGFLLLKSQVIIRGDHLWAEPLSPKPGGQDLPRMPRFQNAH